MENSQWRELPKYSSPIKNLAHPDTLYVPYSTEDWQWSRYRRTGRYSTSWIQWSTCDVATKIAHRHERRIAGDTWCKHPVPWEEAPPKYYITTKKPFGLQYSSLVDDVPPNQKWGPQARQLKVSERRAQNCNHNDMWSSASKNLRG